MSNKYEDLIKNARMNADCGEHMSPTEVTTLLNVVETTFAALAAEVYDLKHPGTYLPSKRETPATDAFLAEVRAQGVDAAIEHLHKKFEGTGQIGVPVMTLEWLAQELRKGGAE